MQNKQLAAGRRQLGGVIMITTPAAAATAKRRSVWPAYSPPSSVRVAPGVAEARRHDASAPGRPKPPAPLYRSTAARTWE